MKKIYKLKVVGSEPNNFVVGFVYENKFVMCTTIKDMKTAEKYKEKIIKKDKVEVEIVEIEEDEKLQ